VHQYIGGRLLEAAGDEACAVLNPATGQTVATAVLAGPAEVDAAVAAARAAFPGWSGATPAERSAALHRLAEVLGERADEFARVESTQTGKPIRLTTNFDAPGTVDNAAFFAGAARHLEGKAQAEYSADHVSSIRREPIGVIGSIAPWNYPLQLAAWKILPAIAAVAASYGEPVEYLDTAAVRAEVDSPTYLGAIWDRSGCAIVNPARLAWGLCDACLSLGVRIHEGTRIVGLDKSATGLVLRTDRGYRIVADHVALATNAFPSLLRRVRPYIVPVYDYALMTEPLSDAQLASIGWRNRQGIGDSANQFHYYRLSRDNRILWGGYDAIYHYGNRIAPELDQRPATFAKLAEHFFETFPQLEGIRFTHMWGGVIDTCTRFCAFFGTAHRGRVAYAAGYTGLGVGATRFGANVMLDLLVGEPTELTELELVRSRPLPFPPEPVRSIGVNLTRWSLDRADRDDGHRNLWLRTLDRLGLGFDS
jgi:glycine/D-amino acid oxidase-like deaminating enzyme